MNALYGTIGVSKQAVHQQAQRQSVFNDRLAILLLEADELRGEHPGCGVEKMYYTLAPDFMGRDRFIGIFMALGYRVKRKRNYHRTTYSSLSYYPNLISGMLLNSPGQVWQSDITYIRLGEDFYYAVFIIDVYTKKIVGWQLSDHMRATANMAALEMALKQHGAPEIHHSDRGSQYNYEGYLRRLKTGGSQPSMGLIAQDNAYAERINRTIKEEYLAYWQIRDFPNLKRKVARAVKHYNTKRKHNGIYRRTPRDFEKEVLTLELHNRPMATIYADGQKKMKMASSPSSFFAQQALQAPNCPIILDE
jgi:hypothetical protein